MPKQSSENILILGLGGVGYYLAKRLSHEGHSITAIESDPDLIRRADGELDARLVRGDVMSFAVWEEAGARGMDYLIAVTDNDAVNILATRIGHRCGIPRKIARVRSLEVWEPDALLSPTDLRIDLVIRPEELAAQEILRLLKMRAGNVVIDVAGGQMQVMACPIAESSPLARMKIKDIAQKYDDFFFRVVVLARGINTIIPGGDHEVLPGDHAFIFAHARDLPKLMTIVGVEQEQGHRVMIVGGGGIGFRLAQLLEGTLPARIVEADERRAEELSYQLPKTQCLHGDGSDADVLVQAGLMDMDTVVTATADNETNIMTSVLAKHLTASRTGKRNRGAAKTIALVKREEYLVLASSMGSDVVLNKKVLAGDKILSYVRRGKLLSVAHLHGCDAEAVELVADEHSPIAGQPLYQVGGTAGKMLIGAVCHEGTWEIAVGSTVIEPGDKAIGICASHHLRDLRKLFGA